MNTNEEGVITQNMDVLCRKVTNTRRVTVLLRQELILTNEDANEIMVRNTVHRRVLFKISFGNV